MENIFGKKIFEKFLLKKEKKNYYPFMLIINSGCNFNNKVMKFNAQKALFLE